jgi:ectoine hydroxylase-related dioxygenase (phytanoyl-CoA dioxygenase family)
MRSSDVRPKREALFPLLFPRFHPSSVFGLQAPIDADHHHHHHIATSTSHRNININITSQHQHQLKRSIMNQCCCCSPKHFLLSSRWLLLLLLLLLLGWNEILAFLPQHSTNTKSYDTSTPYSATITTITTTTTTTTTTTSLFESVVDPKSLLYAEQEKLLVQRGQLEGELIKANSAHPPIPLEVNLIKGASGGGGFGSSGSGGGSKKSLLKTQGKAHASVLKEQGIVRIDNVLPGGLADQIRDTVFQLRKESEALVESGELPTLARFANVLLKENRCDMTIPLGHDDDDADEWVAQALTSVLVDSPVGNVIQTLLGSEAILYEWSCMMSDPSSNRQVMHPDTPYKEHPVLYTCFIALQDIDLDMGPTTWMPQTHDSEIHAQFQDETRASEEDISPKDQLLLSRPTVLGTLRKGSCAIFDSRLLHAGGANTSATSRALLYITFQNHKVTNVGNPGSIRPYLIGQWTLQKLQNELAKYQKGKASEVYSSL